MKSCRLNTVALIWLHGGHQTAPQYRNTGLFCALAWAKTGSILAPAGSTQAMVVGTVWATGADACGALEQACNSRVKDKAVIHTAASLRAQRGNPCPSSFVMAHFTDSVLVIDRS